MSKSLESWEILTSLAPSRSRKLNFHSLSILDFQDFEEKISFSSRFMRIWNINLVLFSFTEKWWTQCLWCSWDGSICWWRTIGGRGGAGALLGGFGGRAGRRWGWRGWRWHDLIILECSAISSGDNKVLWFWNLCQHLPFKCMLGLIKTQCKMEVRILSGGVPKNLTFHGMSKIDFQPRIE